MVRFSVMLVEASARTIYGCGRASADRTIARDIPALSRAYARATESQPGGVLPLYVLSRDYDPAMGGFFLLVGGEAGDTALQAVELPAGTYARVEVRPELGLFWGAAIGRAKRWFYTVWLPGSGYAARNLEYEYHTQKSRGRRPAVDLLFAIGKGDAPQD